MKQTIRMALILAYLLGSIGLQTAQATGYTWKGTAGADLLAAANWDPSGFTNGAVDVCDVAAGGKPALGGTFNAQLNMATGSVLTLSGYQTVANLHLRGGLVLVDRGLGGAIAVDNDSALVGGQPYNDDINSTITGSGNLSFTNREPATRACAIKSASGYSGIWTIYNAAGGSIVFDSVGSGGLKFTPSALRVQVTPDTTCSWDMDLRGASVTVTRDYNDRTHSGPVTLRSACVFTPSGSHSVTFTGKITGVGKFLANAPGGYYVYLGNTASDYSGGTEVLRGICQAKTANALGGGNVHVVGGATLDATVSRVTSNAASLYLDFNGSSYGKINMTAASITTTVAHAYYGGTGGWETAVGYTELAPGTYSNASPGMASYITGSGKLAVVPLITAGIPAILNLDPTNVTASAACMNGYLTSTGGAPVTVSVLWGEADGKTNANAWANTNSFAMGQWNDGESPTTNIVLTADRNYYYTYYAASVGGASYASPSRKFITGALSLQATDSSCGLNGTDTATVVVSRPGTCTNEALLVNYATSGTATNGVDYNASPASGVLQLAAGQTNAVITITPRFPPWNYGAPKSIVLTVTPGLYTTNATSTATCTLETLPSGHYTWIGPAGADWLNAANWTPAGFVNGSGDVCDVNAGGNPSVPTVATFSAQLNLNAGALLNLADYISPTVSNLRLRGGTLVMGGSQNLYGSIVAESNSVLVSGQVYGTTLAATLTGSGNLRFTNRQDAAHFTGISAANGYTGVWTVYNAGGGGIGFDTVGTGGLILPPSGFGVSVNCNTACPWDLDLHGGMVTVTRAYNDNTHSGPVTLRSACVLTPSGHTVTFTGKVSGVGKLLANAPGGQKVILSNATSDYSGGTEVLGATCQATTANALGTGHVHVDSGTILDATTSGVMNTAARLYLDYNGVNYAKINMTAASTTTTVARAFCGGTGGWESPSGYTELAPGLYTSANLANYVTGSGTLKVAPPSQPGTTLLFL